MAYQIAKTPRTERHVGDPWPSGFQRQYLPSRNN